MEALDEENKSDWVHLQMYLEILQKMEYLEGYGAYEQRLSLIKEKQKEEEENKMHAKNHKFGMGDPDCEKCKEIRAYLTEHFGDII
jgi:hypothetical protein